MTLEIPPGWAHVSVEHRATGDPDPWYTTWGIQVPTDGVAAGVEQLLDAYKASFESLLGNHVSVTGANVVVGNDGDPVRFFQPSTGGTWVGDKTTGMLPQNCALLIKKNTGLGGRRHQGRCFMPGGLPEGDVDNVGVIATGQYNLWTTAVNAFLTELDLPLGVGDEETGIYILHNDSGTPPVAPSRVISLVVDPVISTQRRRLR